MIMNRIDEMCTWLQMRIALRSQKTRSSKIRDSIKRGTMIVISPKMCVQTVGRRDMTIAGVVTDVSEVRT